MSAVPSAIADHPHLSPLANDSISNGSSPATQPRRTRVRRGIDASRSAAETPAGGPAMSVRKSTDLVLMRVPEGKVPTISRISLVQRRAINVMLAIAQRIDRTEPGNDGIYSIDIAEFERSIGFQDDGNRKYMLDLVRQLVGFQFEFMDGHTIHVGSVIAEIEVCFRTRQMRFSLPVGMRAKLLHPQRFNHLKLIIQNRFTSHASLMLYEMTSCAYSHPGRRTPSYTWEQLSTFLTGSSTPHKTYREFSKLLGRAIDQVNEVCTSHEVKLMYRREGRATSELWFVVEPRDQGVLQLEHQPTVLSAALISATAAFGLRNTDLEGLMMSHDESYLLAQAELVSRRIQSAAHGSIHSPRAYFLKACEENWADAPRESAPLTIALEPGVGGSPALPLGVASRGVSLDEARTRWWQEKFAVFRDKLTNATPEELAAITADLDDDMKAKGNIVYDSFRRTGLSRPMAMAAAVSILAHREYAEPTSQEIAEFAKTCEPLTS